MKKALKIFVVLLGIGSIAQAVIAQTLNSPYEFEFKENLNNFLKEEELKLENSDLDDVTIENIQNLLIQMKKISIKEKTGDPGP
jgi:hypothetical protein